MPHRPLHVIDAEYRSTAARLNELQLERQAARQAEIDAVTRRFDAGLSQREIARELGKGVAEIQGVLWRSGRTEKGRTAIRQLVDAAMRESTGALQQ